MAVRPNVDFTSLGINCNRTPIIIQERASGCLKEAGRLIESFRNYHKAFYEGYTIPVQNNVKRNHGIFMKTTTSVLNDF